MAVPAKRFEAIRRDDDTWGVWDKQKKEWATKTHIPTKKRAKTLATNMNRSDAGRGDR